MPLHTDLSVHVQSVVLILVFTEPVTGLATTSFSVSGPTGPTIGGLQLVRGTNTYYHVTINVPGDYYGGVTVTLAVSDHSWLLPAPCLPWSER